MTSSAPTPVWVCPGLSKTYRITDADDNDYGEFDDRVMLDAVLRAMVGSGEFIRGLPSANPVPQLVLIEGGALTEEEEPNEGEAAFRTRPSPEPAEAVEVATSQVPVVGLRPRATASTDPGSSSVSARSFLDEALTIVRQHCELMGYTTGSEA